jgi:hypothetical protein
MFFAASNLTNALYLLGMMLIILAVLRGTKKNMKAAKARVDQSLRECEQETLEIRPFSDRPAQIMRWEVEMHDFARDICGRIDSKIAMLQKLLVAAEARERSLSHALSAPVTQKTSTPIVVEPDVEPRVLRRDRLSEIYRLADEGYPSQAIAQQLHSSVGDVELILSLPRS